MALAQVGPPPVDDPRAQILVPAGAVWRYLDDGSIEGDAWRLPDYPDADWETGPAQLGYGDGDEATEVGYGPNADAKYITTWFRHEFNVGDASRFVHVILSLVRDDGAVVYLNGRELVRDNMPAGPISSRTLASRVAGEDENQFHRYDLAASFLTSGRNVLAVEVHQANRASSDLSFDLEMVAVPREGEPLPVVSIHATVPETTEPSPETRVRPGEFTITRTGDDSEPLILFLEYGGTARPETDYAELPQFFVMPAGDSILVIRVEPMDDDLAEGDETVTARLAIPPINSLPNYHIDLTHNEARVIIHDNDPQGLPEVSVFAEPWQTGEPCPECDVLPAAFIFRRGGPVTGPLVIFLQIDGTATPGSDYEVLPSQLEFPSGQNELRVNLITRDDQLIEGPEVVRVRLVDPPINTPTAYLVAPYAGEALAAIFDDEPGAPDARLDIVEPVEGSWFPADSTIRVSAIGVDMKGEIQRPVEFYANDRLIGQSHPIPFARPPIPGLPSLHTILWTNVPAGSHVLTARTELWLDNWLASPPVSITVEGGPALPVVQIEATHRIAEETCDPLERLRFLGEFTISRTGSTDEPLSVFVHYSGLATHGVDYPALPWLVTIPQGASSTTLRVEPVPDSVREGIETLVATLSDCPPDTEPPMGMPCFSGFAIDPAHGQATVFIRDDGITQASVAILQPPEGAVFRIGDMIPIEAVAIALDSYLSRVEFWDGDRLIGVSEIVFIRAPDPGTPILHTFEWRGAAAGPHVLTAQVELLGSVLKSPPVPIHVEGDPMPAVVRIEATERIAEETSDPLDRIQFVGEFTISRTGPMDEPLSVFVHYSGLATPEVDYPSLPWLVTIPEGADSTAIRIEPIPDGVPEGIETLVATLSHCPPETDPPLGMPCVGGFEIDLTHQQATVFIRDDGITEASLVIRRPSEGAVFRAGHTIPIHAIAVDLEGYISRVEFWDGDRQIGVSEIAFFRAPDPGTPIDHWFEWREAAPGAHVLTARAEREGGTPVVSAPVHITVRSEVSQPPHIAITHPTVGAEFPLGTPIEIIAETVDPDGYVPLVEFFADGRKIGERRMVFIRPPDPGQTQIFTFVWYWPGPGPHLLVVRATDADGDISWSEPVEIKVTVPDLLPIVRVTAPDPWAVEPRWNAALNSAMFRIRRIGPTNAPLSVSYSVHGTAINGVDYELLSGSATIPAGERFVNIVLRPLADEVVEHIETVVLRLEDSISTDPPDYRIGFPRRAVALISDRPHFYAMAETSCLGLPGGLFSFCFGAETGAAFRVEGSTDLRNWETVAEAWAVDGAVYFVDHEAGSFERRFYRIVPDPFLKADE